METQYIIVFRSSMGRDYDCAYGPYSSVERAKISINIIHTEGSKSTYDIHEIAANTLVESGLS